MEINKKRMAGIILLVLVLVAGCAFGGVTIYKNSVKTKLADKVENLENMVKKDGLNDAVYYADFISSCQNEKNKYSFFELIRILKKVDSMIDREKMDKQKYDEMHEYLSQLSQEVQDNKLEQIHSIGTIQTKCTKVYENVDVEQFDASIETLKSAITSVKKLVQLLEETEPEMKEFENKINHLTYLSNKMADGWDTQEKQYKEAVNTGDTAKIQDQIKQAEEYLKKCQKNDAKNREKVDEIYTAYADFLRAQYKEYYESDDYYDGAVECGDYDILYRYTLIDFDGDGIKELITDTRTTNGFNEQFAHIYGYQDGKVQDYRLATGYKQHLSYNPDTHQVAYSCNLTPENNNELYNMTKDGPKAVTKLSYSYAYRHMNEQGKEVGLIWSIDGKKVSEEKYEKAIDNYLDDTEGFYEIGMDTYGEAYDSHYEWINIDESGISPLEFMSAKQMEEMESK